MRVWKYVIYPDDYIISHMPSGAKILHIDNQGPDTCMWALVDPNQPMVTRRFRLARTGHPIPEEETKNYVGTFFQTAGLVFHLFDLGERSDIPVDEFDKAIEKFLDTAKELVNTEAPGQSWRYKVQRLRQAAAERNDGSARLLSWLAGVE